MNEQEKELEGLRFTGLDTPTLSKDIARELTIVFLIASFLLGACSKSSKEHINDDLQKEKTLEEYDRESMQTLEEDLHDPAKSTGIVFGQFSRDTLPKKVFSKTTIERLSIFRTNAKTIPMEICKLNRLRELNLSMNRLVNIDGLVCLNKLEYLNLSQNRLEKLPEELGGFFHLTFLDISQNKFHGKIETKLPPNLRQLNVSKCGLKEIPKAILVLDSLEEVNLSSNEITAIPNEIINLKSLKKLIIEDNPLKENELNEARKKIPSCKIISKF